MTQEEFEKLKQASIQDARENGQRSAFEWTEQERADNEAYLQDAL